MAHIAGIELPRDKRILIGLTYIFGIGRTLSRKILLKAGVNESTRVKDLTMEEERRIRDIINNEYQVEGTLRTRVSMDIKRLMEIGCYRGIRHKRGLPVRGQNTHNNARTRKGPKPGKISSKKKASS